jgi:LL-diaminopimelate aminotransferase
VIDFAHKNQVVVVQDAAHILLSYEGEPLSFLQVDGAKEVGVEVHSMSKGFDMIGWRLGFVCGHPKIVQAFADVKDNSDSGQFMAIQHAAAKALRTPEIPERIRAKYRRRLEKLVAALKQAGFSAPCRAGRTSSTRRPRRGGRSLVRQRRGGVAVPDPRAIASAASRGTTPGRSCASR